ncbi:MAG: hypothetical protein AAF152_13985 [Cyanobacteria bacterium P01_A01_bin.114]
MLTPLNTYQIALYSQPSLQGSDLRDLLTLAKAQDIIEDTENWCLDQWLGLTMHLLMTSRAPQTQNHLAQILPKFGSRAVFPLVKLLHISWEALQKLALQSLRGFEQYSLAIGLVPLLKTDKTLRPVVRQLLIDLNKSNDAPADTSTGTPTGTPIVLALARLLSTEDWQTLELQSLLTSLAPLAESTKKQRDLDSTLDLKVFTDGNSNQSRQNKKRICDGDVYDSKICDSNKGHPYPILRHDAPGSFVGWLISSSCLY